ncbi:hypothetical protein [Planctomicrobium piriforme]|uniref:Uncharacterized protein n=1 Tax=Planctomicrobium piriforme TaxID=1576369 RepID=A0A1I3ECT1_9PLAN|nr:hypothetical protein [Planctomicrobium piriforme]SFH96782.1 hypothetical protein SAMN05421753_104168 [Planctomicrobium piriforme]
MDWLEPFLKIHPHLRAHVDLLAVPPDAAEALAKYPQLEREPDLLERANRLVCHNGQGHGLTVLALYMVSRRKRSSHTFAAMAAMQQSARVNTNDTFWSGRKHFSQVYGETYANDIKKKLAAQGVNMMAGEYMPEIARYRGDPEAYVPFSGARDHIRKVCEKRGWACEGAVNVKGREPEKDPHAPENGVALAEDLVVKKAGEIITKNPELKRKTKGEIRQMVTEKHGRQK